MSRKVRLDSVPTTPAVLDQQRGERPPQLGVQPVRGALPHLQHAREQNWAMLVVAVTANTTPVTTGARTSPSRRATSESKVSREVLPPGAGNVHRRDHFICCVEGNV
jgi:hypothetical protein